MAVTPTHVRYGRYGWQLGTARHANCFTILEMLELP
jgi:hypothetical protein